MYKDIAKIYIGDLTDATTEELFTEVQSRLEFANNKYNAVDDFYLDVVKDEITSFSNFNSIEKDYIVYREESTDKTDNTEPWLVFSQEDLKDYTDYLLAKGTSGILKFNYIER